jgi:ribosomal subunit interface protein
MTLRVSGKNLDIGEALRQHVLEKVEATVGRYSGGSVSGHVVVTRDGSGYRSDCTLLLSSGINLHAEGRAHDPYQCFDQAAHKIEIRLRRYKARLKDHSGVSATHARGKVANYLIEQPSEEEDEPAEGFNPVVVAEGTEDLKSLSVASAVAELDLTGASVLVFQHAGSGRVNVVYRRRDGAIGWLDAQAPREPPRAA